MQLKKIKNLIEIMDEKNLTKIDYEDGELKISLERDINTEPKDNIEDEWITSPTVGIYLDREKPLKIGQRVKKNEVLFIINSMKVLNNIVAPKDGIIEKILVKENDILEYNQKVMKLGCYYD